MVETLDDNAVDVEAFIFDILTDSPTDNAIALE
jgi:hypothetical protein